MFLKTDTWIIYRRFVKYWILGLDNENLERSSISSLKPNIWSSIKWRRKIVPQVLRGRCKRETLIFARFSHEKNFFGWNTVFSRKKGTFTFPLPTWWKTMFEKNESRVAKVKHFTIDSSFLTKTKHFKLIKNFSENYKYLWK